MEGEKWEMNEEIERQSAHKQLFDDKLGWDGGIDGWRRPEVSDGIGSEIRDTLFNLFFCKYRGEGQQHLFLHNAWMYEQYQQLEHNRDNLQFAIWLNFRKQAIQILSGNQ